MSGNRHGNEGPVRRESPLILAVMDNNPEEVRRLLEGGADVREHGDLVIRYAVEEGNSEVIRALISAGANHLEFLNRMLREVSKNIYIDLDIGRFLLESGASASDYTTMSEASVRRNYEFVKLLLENGADIHAGNEVLLFNAVEHGDLEFARFLLERGANPRALLGDEDIMEQIQGNAELMELLREYDVDINPDNDAALRNAASNGHLETVRMLIEAGADVHANNDEALRTASRYGQLEVVYLLLNAGADVHANNDEALRTASRYGQLEVVHLLLEADADINALTSDLVIMEEIQNNVELMALLRLANEAQEREVVGAERPVPRNYNSDSSDEDSAVERPINRQPLIVAVENNDIEEVRWMLQRGIRTSSDVALELACRNGNINIVRLLVEHGVSVAALDAETLADVSREYPQLANFLREHDAIIHIPVSADERRRAALEQEEKNEQLRIAAIDEVKKREEKAPENPFVEANCSSSENLYGDPLKDTDDIVVFQLSETKGDCYLKEELKLLRSDQYVRGVGEKAYKLPWSNIWITKTLKEFAENMEGHGPIPLKRSQNYVGYNSANVLWVLREE